MICPICAKEFKPATPAALHSADTYHNPVHVRAECCGGIVQVVPRRSYELRETVLKVDDWGNVANFGKSRE